jgi:hypothetical protein
MSTREEHANETSTDGNLEAAHETAILSHAQLSATERKVLHEIEARTGRVDMTLLHDAMAFYVQAMLQSPDVLELIDNDLLAVAFGCSLHDQWLAQKEHAINYLKLFSVSPSVIDLLGFDATSIAVINRIISEIGMSVNQFIMQALEFYYRSSLESPEILRAPTTN